MKKETLKLLKNIGVDTRYISYTPTTIYINNLRFSKFSRKKEETFKKYYPQTTIIRSSLLQKICNRASKILSQQLKPKDKITLPKITNKKIKFIILTHNSEFMSILMDNNIAQLRLQLKKGDITKMKRSLLLPYEYHLTDIKEIAENKKQPCHTTANSIRHIIETIMHFEEPKNNDIKSFIKEDETLSTSGSLYTLINAESHGWFHKQSAVSDDELIDICKLIIDFIGEKYPKQLIE